MQEAERRQAGKRWWAEGGRRGKGIASKQATESDPTTLKVSQSPSFPSTLLAIAVISADIHCHSLSPPQDLPSGEVDVFIVFFRNMGSQALADIVD